MQVPVIPIGFLSRLIDVVPILNLTQQLVLCAVFALRVRNSHLLVPQSVSRTTVYTIELQCVIMPA